MASLNYRKILRLHEQEGPDRALELITEQFREKVIRPQDIDLANLFIECFGWHEFNACRRGHGRPAALMERMLLEASGAVSTASFLNVGGQFMFQNVLDGYMHEEDVFRTLIPEKQASTLDGEKVPGITDIGDEAAVRGEAEPYTLAGVGENWIFTPSIKDRGFLVPITWEALFNDKTGQLADRASQVGKWMGRRREKLAIDAIIDENTTDHRYNWRGTTIATYGDNSGTHTWDNLAASNALVDWTDVDVAEQLFNGLLDPFTGEPIDVQAKHLIVTKQLEQTANHTMMAEAIRRWTPGFATSGNPNMDEMGNPYRNKYEIKTSKLLAARMATDTSWYLGDVSKLAWCMIAEPMNVQQAPPNSHDDFHRRIVVQHRVNERFAYVVVEPRAVVKNTA